MVGRQVLGVEQLGMNPNHEHLLVVRPVEDADHAAPRQLLFVAPEIVVVQLLVRGDLEGVDVHPLRIHATHDVLDGAVLAGSIEALQDHEQGVRVLGGQPVLVLGQQRDALLQQVLSLAGIVLAEIGRETRIEVVRQFHDGARLDAKPRGQLPEAFQSGLGHALSLCWR